MKITLALLCSLIVTASGQISLSNNAPTSNIIATKTLGGTNTTLFPLAGTAPAPIAGNANHARGQLFSLGDGSGNAFELTAVTVQKNHGETFSNDSLTLRIFEGTESQWTSGTGHTASDTSFYNGTGVTQLYTEVFTLNGVIEEEQFVTLTLATPIAVNENSDFGFFLTYDPSSGTSPVSFTHLEASNGGRISITTTDHGTSSRGMNHFVQGNEVTSGVSVLQLASPFQDRMVLQRDKPITVWGTASADADVSVSLNGISATTTADAIGKWEANLPASSAGGPYTLDVTSGTASSSVNDVLVGDVWFCYGQSNMVFTLNQMAAWHTFYEEAIEANDNIRCLKITQDASLTEDDSAGMTWLSNSDAGPWSAVASVFAHQLHESTGVPTAVIWAAWGSSSIEGWLPLELSDELPHFDEMLNLYQSIGEYRDGVPVANRATNNGYSSNLEMITDLTANGWPGNSNSDGDVFMRTRPNIIYNKMIHPMRHYGISGFIWYQGEANADDIINVAQYHFTLPRMVTEYRERFDQGDLPFLGVQLPSFNEAEWPWFREAQDTLLTLNNAHVAVTLDTGFQNNIHPTDKEPIGVRLALMAREFSLGESIESLSPRFETMSINGSDVELTFTNDIGLTIQGGGTAGAFEISGADQIFHDATTSSLSRGVLTISSPSVSNPVAVRYAWNPFVANDVNVINGADLPLAPFRTDSWPLPGLAASAPAGNDDFYTTVKNQTLNVPVNGVLENDFDLNFDLLETVSFTQASSGVVTLLADGSFSYVPQVNFTGTDTFTYQSSEIAGSLSSSNTTVTITVLPSTYDTWSDGISWNAGDDESATGDSDEDGIPNLLEFALGLDPLVTSSAGLPTVTPSTGGAILYDFNLAQPTLTYEVLVSTDLETWSDPAFATLTGGSITPVSIPESESADGKLFIRLKVSE